MEWYFGNEAADLVVPKGYEQAQTISSSPENWLQWSSYPKKNTIHEELAYNGGKSKNSSMIYNNSGSLLWNDEADFQQFAYEEARINHMIDDDDDIFFSSLLEEDPTEANTIEGKMVNVTTYQMPKYTSTNENLMEESVLNDLERVSAQFTDKTRICLRDAFYRLAESSKQPLNSCQDGESMMTSNDDTLRGGETEDSEYKTNVIDRAVVSLVFQKFDFDDTCRPDYNNDADFCDLEV